MKGMLRPKMIELPASARVPASAEGRPPRRFTHTVTATQPYYFEPDGAGAPSGYLEAGVRVARRDDAAAADTLSAVTDARGLRVFTPTAGLAPLPAPPRTSRRPRR